jgi:hypothetical protein
MPFILIALIILVAVVITAIVGSYILALIVDIASEDILIDCCGSEDD